MKIELDIQPAASHTPRLSEATLSRLRQGALIVVFLACSLAVFMFGANYYPLFSTNGNLTFVAGLTIFFLAGAVLLKHSARFSQYWQISFAFFVASAVNLVSILFAGNFNEMVERFGVTDQNVIAGLDKVYDTLILVIPAIVLVRASGADLKSIYLARGNQYWKWGMGIGCLVLANLFTSVLIFFGTGYKASMLGPAIIWGVVFAFSNSLLEELWVRGLFLKKYIPLIGVTGSVLVTSITFAALHFLSVAYLPSSVIPIFVINTFTLGLACAILMIKTDSIWGAYLIHAAADLFLFIAILAVR